MSTATLLNHGTLILVGAVVATMALHASAPMQAMPTWQLIYAHDENGQAVAGSKEGLLEAVRSGKSIRIYWSGRHVEHAVDAYFLTILGGEVFAQTAPIQSQAPSLDPPAVAFRQPGQQWRTIIGTDGSVRAFMDGNQPRQHAGARRWFVQQ